MAGSTKKTTSKTASKTASSSKKVEEVVEEKVEVKEEEKVEEVQKVVEVAETETPVEDKKVEDKPVVEEDSSVTVGKANPERCGSCSKKYGMPFCGSCELYKKL